MFEIVGIKKTSFNGKDGNKVEGLTFHCINYDYMLDNGVAVEKLFVPAARGYGFSDFHAGQYVNFTYNRFGKVQSVEVVEK